MTGKFKLLLALLFICLQSSAQCDDYGSIVISEIYFDSHYTENITSKYHSFGEYIELYNSSNQPIDLTDWVIKDNHTQFKFTVNEYNQDVIIKPGGYKVITYNGFYANPAYPSAGNPSLIGGRAKFKELFPQAVGHDEDIILQNTMVLYNITDKVSLYNPRGRLVDEVSYLNAPNFNPVPDPLTYMGIQEFTYVVNPTIMNFDGGVFNGQMGMAPTYTTNGQPILDGNGNPVLAMHNNYLQAIYRSQPANYYVDGGKVFQNAVTTPFSIPFSIPLKDPDPRFFMPAVTDENTTEEIIYDTTTGSAVAHTMNYYDEMGKSTVSLSRDFETNFTWGSETTYDIFGRQASTSFPAITCYGMEKVNFLTEQTAYTYFLEKYYSTDNTYEPYQAIATDPYSTINYDKLNPGNVINVVGGNKINGDWKTGYSFTVSAAQEMYYVYGYGYYDGPIVAGKEELITKFYKKVEVDPNGEENVAFIDGEGKVLATARTGGSTYPVHSLIGIQGYVDVHIPKGITTAQITLIGGGSLYDVYDLRTGLQVSVTTLTGGNAYRVQSKVLPLTDPKMYVTNVTSGVLSFDADAKGISYRVNYYDYAVNIYNSAGQIIKHVQPNGYQNNTTIKATPTHMAPSATNFIVTYKYNALGQLVESLNPDEGLSTFVYRKDGQIRYSQNAKQKNEAKLSYVDYDRNGRPIESGVLPGTFAQAVASPDGSLLSLSRTEQVFNIYDYADNFEMLPLVSIPASQSLATLLGTNIQYYQQNNLSGNLAMTFKTVGATVPAMTWYSYDIYGRVEWIVQYNQEIGVKTIDYEYDYKGNLIKTLYQQYYDPELFVHKYTYDLNNVLKKVETSTDNSTFITHADYSYYLTGELKRLVLAKGMQGIDYVYTLGGMLKSINHPSLEQMKDPGGDANDLFGMTLDYYAGDYTRAGTNITTSPVVAGYNKDQYNGNIKAVRWANKQVDMEGGILRQKGYAYNYNKNNWLINANFGNVNALSSTIVASSKYTEGNINYDANGNILSLNRTNHQGTLVDRLLYTYDGNKLNFIREDAVPTTLDLTDIENQSPSNYGYDAIGRLERNTLEGLVYSYNTHNLVTAVLNSANSNKPIVAFDYNERGQRIRKRTFNSINSQLLSTDYYVLDAAGKVMSIYTKSGSNPIVQKELPIYGLGRHGIFFKADGTSKYEIKDHLGNVRAVVQKIPNDPFAQMLACGDYYPFGEKLPERNLSGNYRYAFQGQELDTETGMEAFQLRLWDGRIGRWLSPDPYGQYSSPYLGMGNNPISSIDSDGGWETWFGAFWHNLWDNRSGNVFKSEEMGDWGIRYEGGFDSEGPIVYAPNFGGKRYNNNEDSQRLLSFTVTQQVGKKLEFNSGLGDKVTGKHSVSKTFGEKGIFEINDTFFTGTLNGVEQLNKSEGIEYRMNLPFFTASFRPKDLRYRYMINTDNYSLGNSIGLNGVGNHYSQKVGDGFTHNFDSAFRPGGYTALLVALVVAPQVTFPIAAGEAIPVLGL